MIDPKDLTCIIVMENDSGIVNYAIQSIIKFTNPCPKILICENTGNVKSKACELVPFKIKHKDLIIVKNPLGEKPFNTSERHGLGLNKLMRMVNTEYTAIIESDICLLSKNWIKLDTSKYDIKAAFRGKKRYRLLVCLFFII